MFFFAVPIVVKYKKESSSFDSSLLLLCLRSELGDIPKSVSTLLNLLTTAARMKHVLFSVSYDFLYSFFAHLLHKYCQVESHSLQRNEKFKILSNIVYCFAYLFNEISDVSVCHPFILSFCIDCRKKWWSVCCQNFNLFGTDCRKIVWSVCQSNAAY